jgi:hypothetical protein
MNISGSTFLVMGGCSGLGEACARRLVACDANAVVADLNEDRGAALAVELGQRARFIKTDATDEASAAAWSPGTPRSRTTFCKTHTYPLLSILASLPKTVERILLCVKPSLVTFA